jgi:UV DNA damage endonuclease
MNHKAVKNDLKCVWKDRFLSETGYTRMTRQASTTWFGDRRYLDKFGLKDCSSHSLQLFKVGAERLRITPKTVCPVLALFKYACPTCCHLFLGTLKRVRQMIVRFGFVAMSMQLKNASPSKNMTEKTLKQIGNRGLAAKKVIRLAKENLNNTKRILYHALAHDIRLYRFSSRLIPLAAHPAFQKINFVRVLVPQLRQIGQIVRENGMRVGFHPEHFTVLNSPRPEVIRSSVRDLIRHIRMLHAMGLDEGYKCNIHVGGAYGDKEVSAERFITTFRKLNPRIQAHICLENDDTTFTARETLEIAQTVGVPCVLDLHHHRLNHGKETLEELWP